MYAPSPAFALVGLPCGGALTSCSPFRGGASTMCSPSCIAICSSQAGPHLLFHVCIRPQHAPRSNASSFAAGAFSAPVCRLDAGGSLGGWCSAHNWQRSPLFVHVNCEGSTSLASALASQPRNPPFMHVNTQWDNFPRVHVAPSFVRVDA